MSNLPGYIGTRIITKGVTPSIKQATSPKPAAPAPKRETADDVAVRVAIESAKAERQKREQAQLHRLTLLAQVAGCHVNEVGKLMAKPA